MESPSNSIRKYNGSPNLVPSMSFPWPSVIRRTTEGVGAVPLTMDVGIPGCGVCPYRYEIDFMLKSSFIQLHEDS